jgi:hypothetical protein
MTYFLRIVTKITGFYFQLVIFNIQIKTLTFDYFYFTTVKKVLSKYKKLPLTH